MRVLNHDHLVNLLSDNRPLRLVESVDFAISEGQLTGRQIITLLKAARVKLTFDRNIYLQIIIQISPPAFADDDYLNAASLLTYRSPRSAKLSTEAPATMIWSSTRTSTNDNACLRACVSSSSDLLGSATPLGWLCANITAAAL